jgi:hypothetical protein
MHSLVPQTAVFSRQYVQAFVNILDTLARQQGKALWLEKTPDHLQYIAAIERLIPGARFIHIIRNAPDVIASLYYVTNRYPEQWGGAWDIEYCITKWVDDVALSRKYVNDRNHIMIEYEELVREPQVTLAGLCEFLDLPFDLSMMQVHSGLVKDLVLDYEVWKTAAKGPIDTRRTSKFQKVLNDDQRRYVLERLAQLTPSRSFEETS